MSKCFSPFSDIVLIILVTLITSTTPLSNAKSTNTILYPKYNLLVTKSLGLIYRVFMPLEPQ